MANLTKPIILDETGQAIATAISTLGATNIGNLSSLTTTDKTSLVGAVNEVNSNKQNATDNNLETTNKTVVGGINELKTTIGGIKDGTNIDSFADVETALADKQDATDNSLETEAKTIVGAINENASDIGQLKSGLTNVDVALSVPNGSGKNKLPMTLDGVKAANTSGTWSNNTYTLNGVTFTVNIDSDGHVTGIKATGTASARTDFILMSNILFSANSYILNGCPKEGSSNTYLIIVGTTTDRLATDTGSASGFSISEAISINSSIRIMSGYSIPSDGLMFYPMIRPATITDATFAPYIPSVESRLEALEAAIAQLTNG